MMQSRKSKSRPSQPQKPCSPARLGALHVLEAVFSDGKSLLDTMDDLQNHCKDPRDLGLAREIVSGSCRWHGPIRHILTQSAPRLGDFPPTIQRILEMSVYQILYLDRVPEYAVLSDAVELARAKRMKGLASAVNGILRTVTRKRDEFSFPDESNDYTDHLAVTQSHPKWLIERWLNIWVKDSVQWLCEFNNTLAPLSLRVRSDMETALAALETYGIAGQVDSRLPGRIVLETGCQVPRQLFESVDWVVQDGAAMLIAPLLAPQPGWKIWDVCAAPGGKTAHLSDLTGNQAQILASDSNASRLQKLWEYKKRLNLESVTIEKIDALQKQFPFEKDSFDAILVDAPCSGWGTFRRHPDLRWRQEPDDPGRFGRQALRILESVQTYVKPGGVLVYGTCTLSPEENEEVIGAFLDRHQEFTVEPVSAFLSAAFQNAQTKEGYLFVFPPPHGMDGAFAARLRRVC